MDGDRQRFAQGAQMATAARTTAAPDRRGQRLRPTENLVVPTAKPMPAGYFKRHAIGLALAGALVVACFMMTIGLVTRSWDPELNGRPWSDIVGKPVTDIGRIDTSACLGNFDEILPAKVEHGATFWEV